MALILDISILSLNLEVVDRLHDIDGIDRLGNGADDVVDGALARTCRVIAFHIGPAGLKVKVLPCDTARYDAAGAVPTASGDP